MDANPQQIEVFIQIKNKIDDIMDIVEDAGMSDIFMASYCFGLANEDEDAIHYMAGYNVDDVEEIQTMYDTVIKDYIAGKIKRLGNSGLLDELMDGI